VTKIKFTGVQKQFPGGSNALESLDLTIDDGEFITLLGPSGCGKTTTLRLLAGLETLTKGEIFFNDKRIDQLAPAKRNIALVFQNYALYPHMTVRGNLEYPLKKHDVPKAERTAKIDAVATILQIEELLERKPRQLSGGQQQRVALGRAMIRDPAVFLFDEPLSNLDAQLRATMRVELTRLHARLRKTMVYVTHDQLEAMTMSTRIVVMLKGHLQQVGTPAEIYSRPANRFVAGFVGTPSMSFLDGAIGASTAGPIFKSGLPQEIALPASAKAVPDTRIVAGIRSEHVTIGEGTSSGDVVSFEAVGHETLVTLATAAGPLTARAAPDIGVRVGDRIAFHIADAAVHFFDTGSGVRIEGT